MKLDIGMLTHDLKTLPDYARKIEAMGYDCLWSAETQHDPFLPLAVAAAQAVPLGDDSVQFGVWVSQTV